MTAREVIKAAMRLLSVIDPNEDPTPIEYTNGLEALNLLVGYWGTQSLVSQINTRNSHTLTPGTAYATIGTGAAGDTACPTKIISAYIRSSDIDTPLEIITQEEYAAIPDKTASGTPEKLSFERTGSSGVIYLWPVPDAADTLLIESTKPYTAYTLDQALGLPAEYERAAKFSLALELAPEFAVMPNNAVVVMAQESLATIRAINSQPVPRTVTNTMGISGSSYNVYTDRG